MRVYISCHAPEPANAVAKELIATGHTITSTWHTDDTPKTQCTDESMRVRANINLEQIDDCHALVFIASVDSWGGTSYGRGPFSKYVETGYAMASGVRVLVVGGVEDSMFYADGVYRLDNTAAVLAKLKEIDAVAD